MDVRGIDQAGVAQMLAREQRWKALWLEAQMALAEEREQLRLLKEEHERCVTGRE